MVVPYYIKMTEEKPQSVAIRAWREVVRSSHRDIGLDWFHEKFSGHFEPGADARYHYKKRSQRYLDYKAKLFRDVGTVKVNRLRLQLQGSGQDLVLTGTLSHLLAATFDARGYPSRVTLTAEATVYAPQHQKKPGPDLIDESFRVSPSELRDYKKRLGQYIHSRLTAVGGKRVTKFPSSKAA
jgi:hypothetical protein